MLWYNLTKFDLIWLIDYSFIDWLIIQGATYEKDRLLKDPDVAETYCELHNCLACQYASMERFEEAEKIHKELLSIKEK